ncbi:MAG: hypothetical protein KDA48_17230, partial [Amphiplicatus sp.]|nr:hypothetical protein [Amphiplicatus sp.]
MNPADQFREATMSSYGEVYGAWKKDPEAFWAQAAKEIDWIKPP